MEQSRHTEKKFFRMTVVCIYTEMNLFKVNTCTKKNVLGKQ